MKYLLLLATAAAAADPAFPSFADFKGKAYNVSYDKRAITVDGQHALFLSGAVHPPRGSPEMWDGWFRNAKANGLNMVQVRPSFLSASTEFVRLAGVYFLEFPRAG